MPKGNVHVAITADSSGLKRETKQAERHLGAFGKTAGKLAALGGVTVGAAGLAAGLQSVVSASIEAEKSQAKLNAQLRTIGKSSDEVKKQIDRVVQSQSLMSGFDDEALTESFTNIVRTTGNVTKSLELNNIAMDLARAKNIDVAKAGELVAKVAGGNTGILARYGFSIEKGATASEALAVLQKRLAGQAEAYGRTQAGSIDRMNVAFENLREKLGDALAPAVTKAADTVARFVTQMQNGTGDGGRFVDTMKELWKETQPVAKAALDVVKALARFGKEHPEVVKVAVAMAAVGTAVKGIRFASKISGLSTFLSAARTGATTFRGLWARAGTNAADDAVGNLATRTGKTLPDKIRAQRVSIRGAGRILGGIFAAGAAAVILVEVGKAIDEALGVTPKGRERSNKADPNNFFGILDKLKNPQNLIGGGGAIIGTNLPEIGGAPRGAAAAAANGLRGSAAGLSSWLGKQGFQPTSTYRSNSSTYHGTGQAIDYGTSRNNLHNLARVLWPFRSQFEELFIPTWAPNGGLYHNGKKFSSPSLQAAHQDHIHVADTGGRFAALMDVGGGAGGQRVVVKGRGSWFGGPRDSMDSGRTASGGTTATPGCAIRPGDHYNSGRPYLGGVWRITAPNGKTANVRQTDIGPNQSTGRRIDITYSALGLFGYNEKNFPTDGTFTAVYLGKTASTSRAPRLRMPGFKPTGSSFGYGPNSRRRANTNRGIRNAVNTARGTRLAGQLDTNLTLATITPGLADDVAAATAGYQYWDTKVRQYAYGLRNGDTRVTNDMLTDAISNRDRFSSANPMIASDVGGVLTGGTEAAAGTGGDIAALTEEIRKNREFAQAILQTTGGQALTGIIAQMASTGIGSSFGLVNQAAGRGAGLHASY